MMHVYLFLYFQLFTPCLPQQNTSLVLETTTSAEHRPVSPQIVDAKQVLIKYVNTPSAKSYPLLHALHPGSALTLLFSSLGPGFGL